LPKEKPTPEVIADVPDGIAAVRPTGEIMTNQPPSFVGASGGTTGAPAISIKLVVIPPLQPSHPLLPTGL
jgi:hypothetical protein